MQGSEDIVKKVIENVKPDIKGDVHNTGVSINNSKFNIPLDSIAKTATIGGATAAGIAAGAKMIVRSPMHPLAKLAFVGASGVVGGTAVSVANGISTIVQGAFNNKGDSGSEGGPSGGDLGNFGNFPSIEFPNNSKELSAILEVLNGNFIIHVCILIFIWGLVTLLIANKIVNKEWGLTFMKTIFGERIHKFIIKCYNFTSKSNNFFIVYGIIFLIISNIIALIISVFLISFIDTITKMVLSSLNSDNVSNIISIANISVELDINKIMILLYINCIIHIVMLIIIMILGLLFMSSNKWKLVLIKSMKLNILMGVLLYIMCIIAFLISLFLVHNIHIISVIIQNKI
jgi:hypothetical protein